MCSSDGITSIKDDLVDGDSLTLTENLRLQLRGDFPDLADDVCSVISDIISLKKQLQDQRSEQSSSQTTQTFVHEPYAC